MVTDNHKWYVLRAISGKEKKTKELIEQDIERAGLSSLLTKVIIPTEKVLYLKEGKKYTKEKNFFPGYILVQCAMEGELPHVIKNVPNVLGFLKEDKTSETPMPMREEEINRILGKVDELEVSKYKYAISYSVNETVKITDGPFSGFSGIIEEVNDERKKVKVIVQIFGRKTPMELGFLQVEKN